jgi:Tol biopolymer transport system component/DNA-binding winged helix-turn-helix (wHTH) protein
MTNTLEGRPVVYEFGVYRLEPQRRVLARADGSRVEIAAKAFDLLLYLVARAGSVVTRDELMKALWPRAIVEDNSLNKLVAAVRRALGERQYIATLQGRGYQFVAEVRVVAAPADVVPQAKVGPAAADAPPAAPAQAARSFSPLPGPTLALLAGVSVALIMAFVARDRDNGAPDTPSNPLGPIVRTATVTAFPGDEYSPTLSPDGTRVAFSWEPDDGNRDIYVTMTDGTGLQRLTQAPESDGDPAWSPDGRRIAFLRRVTTVQRDIFVIPALGGTEQRVHSLYLRTIPDVNVAAPKLAWTHDGERLVFASGREGGEGTHVYALAPESGALTQLTFGEAVYDNSAALSSDGSWLAFRRDPANPSPVGTLMVQKFGPGLSRTGEPVAVPTGGREIFHSPSWSADGRYLRFVAGSNIHEWQVGAAAPRLVHNASGLLGGSTPSAGEVSRLEIARGEPVIGVVARVGSGPDIWGIPLDRQTRMPTGEPDVRFFSSAGEIHPRYSPDGKRVAFVSRRGGTVQLWTADANGASARVITNMDADAVVYPNWSPDGERLVFYTSGDDGFQIYIIEVDGGPPQHVVPGGGPSWSSDGEHLYVTEAGAPFTVTRVRISDRHREPLFTGHLAFESADGRQLLYWKGQETHVYKRSLGGNVADNPEERLVETVVGGIAPVDGGFYYVAVSAEGIPRAFAFYDYASRESREIAPAPRGTMGVGGLTVSPDGTELLYAAQVSESGSDLVLLEFGRARAD